jgi:hypothetical protein
VARPFAFAVEQHAFEVERRPTLTTLQYNWLMEGDQPREPKRLTAVMPRHNRLG